MVIFKHIDALQTYLRHRRAHSRIGFVPTMGALHEGHLGLIRTSRSENRITVSSIFVNPTQFNDPKDFEKYPVTLENDIRLLEKQGCDVLFLPSVNEIYPEGLGPGKEYDLGELDNILEGKFRPGHFQGVCRVVHRLLTITGPDKLYLGRKDYQQCMVISRLVELEKLPVEIRICPTMRESDGLAMSSRNMRLSPQARAKAPLLHSMLVKAKNELAPGDLTALRTSIMDTLEKGGFQPEYFEFADARQLAITTNWDGKQELVALVAAFLDGVRLIDNMELG